MKFLKSSSRIFAIIGATAMWLSNVRASDVIYPKDADAFLSKAGCQFSAYVVYNGKEIQSALGTLKSGQAMSAAICIDTYHTQGAKPVDLCWLRPVDMKRGQYIADSSSAFKVFGGPCSKEKVAELLSRPSISEQLKFKAAGEKEWRVATDQFGVKDDFKKIFEVKEPPKGKYHDFQWCFFSASSECGMCIGDADKAASWYSNKVKSVTKSKLVIKADSRPEPDLFYVSEKDCKNDKNRYAK